VGAHVVGLGLEGCGMNALRALRMAAGSVMDRLNKLGFVDMPRKLRKAIDNADPTAVVISAADARELLELAVRFRDPGAARPDLAERLADAIVEAKP